MIDESDNKANNGAQEGIEDRKNARQQLGNQVEDFA